MKLYHYVCLNGEPNDEHRRQLIGRRIIYFSDPNTFDDVFDCNVPGWDAARSKLVNCRVFCLSMEGRDDNLMFSLYGDRHKGIRLRFTVNRDLPLAECTHLTNGRPVEYVEALPPYDCQRGHMFYYYKSVSWAYQSEYRVLMPRLYGEYTKSELTEIALGLHFDMKYLRELTKWVQDGEHSNVTFKRGTRSSSALGIEYDPIIV